jgi:hypothetical protein
MRRLLLSALFCLCVPSTGAADLEAWRALAEAEPGGERTPPRGHLQRPGDGRAWRRGEAVDRTS